MVRTRVCSVCGETFPLTRDYYCKDGNKYRRSCKFCHVVKAKEFSDGKYATLDKVLQIRCQTAKQRAKRKGLKFDITPEFLLDMWDRQNGRCYYSNLPMSFDRNDLYTVSIDRIDSNGGYTKNNVVLSCWSINSAKNNFTVSDYIHLCAAVAAYNQ